MKTLRIVMVLAICLILPGCVYYKSSSCFIRGEDVKIPLGSPVPFGGDVAGLLHRQVLLTNESGRELPSLSDVTLTIDSKGVGSVTVVKTEEVEDAVQD